MQDQEDERPQDGQPQRAEVEPGHPTPTEARADVASDQSAADAQQRGKDAARPIDHAPDGPTWRRRRL